MGAQAINGKQQSLVTYSMNQEYKVNNIFILSLGFNVGRISIQAVF